MIAASEPLEFVPHGRRAISRHPGSVLKSAATNAYPLETSLLHKLKNVAITDRNDYTYLQKDQESNQNEWWCVRQMIANGTRKQHNDVDVTLSTAVPSSQSFKSQPPQRSANPDNPSLKLKHDFSIKTELSTSNKRQQQHLRASDNQFPGSSRVGSSLDNFCKSMVTPSPIGSPDDQFSMPDPKVECCYEEELYVKGKTAIWSRGHVSNPDSKLYDPESRMTVTCYTCESNIKHALFCNFHATVNDRLMYDALNSLIAETKSDIKIKDNFEDESLNPIPSICIVDQTSLRVFTEDGQDFITSLQFQVKSVWSTKYGILLEKDAAPPANTSYIHNVLHSRSRYDASTCKNTGTRTSMGSGIKLNLHTLSQDNFCAMSTAETDVQLPTCFSLSHPLDEMAPALMKISQYGGIQYYNDGSMQIVFVSQNPSIALVFCNKTGLHSLFSLRKATSEECHSICGDWNKTNSVMSPSINLNFGNSVFSTSQKTTAGNGQKNTTASWLAGSPYTSKPGSMTNSLGQSRTESPMAGLFTKLGLSPHSSIGQASNSSMLAANARPVSPTQPLYPDLCFEHIWTESQGVPRDNVSMWTAATKAFLHTDHTNQHYLCFLVSYANRQLQIARLERPHSNAVEVAKRPLIVGVVTSIPARDAVVLPILNAIAVIDLSGNIILYSGTSVMGKVHIGGVLTGLITSPYNQTNVFDTSFPRRSSLLPTSHYRDVPVLDDSALHQLSPVPRHFGMHSLENKTLDSGGLQCLRDPVGNRVTLEYEKGVFYRITLPDLTTSSLILKSINALKQVLQKDIIMQVISKWYGVRNAPGTQDLCPKLEWSMFVSLILNLLGYDTSKLPLTKQTDTGTIPEVAPKKQRTSSDGSQEDWEYLLNSHHHETVGSTLAVMLNLTKPNNLFDKRPTMKGKLTNNIHKFGRPTKLSSKAANDMDTDNPDDFTHNMKVKNFNTNALLFPYMLPILYAFHLVYEELKMNILLSNDMESLAQFLHQICVDLRLTNYVCHYWKDYPVICPMPVENKPSQISDQDIKRLNQPVYFTVDPPSIFSHLFQLMKGNNNQWFPYMNTVNTVCRDVIEVTGLIANGIPGPVQPVMSTRDCVNASSTPRFKDSTAYTDLTNIEQAVVLMICMKGYTLRDLGTLPPAINLYILNTISRCKNDPPVDWPDKAYSLIMREDLALRAKYSDSEEAEETRTQDNSMKEDVFTQHKDPDPENFNIGGVKTSEIEKTGLELIDTKILRLRFPDDHRVAELANMLQSSVPVTIALTQRPEVSDHDFIEEQERHLLALCNRTMALSVGRGMVTLRSIPCVITEPLFIPKLCLTGRAPPRNAVIDLTHIEVSPTVSQWPLFHNGVAAGLKLVPMGNSNIDSAWVVYNKPKVGNAQELPTEHAGFLMALGLNGHLKDMAFMNVYEYLVKCHEMTSVGLLLGIAATYRGTMDISITKLMGIHVEALLPPTSIELDIPQNIQVAALLGVGLLYQGTAHTHMTQVLLSEIGRPPGPEMENSSEREGYALAAGLALGLVVLGANESAPQHLAPSLSHYMLGGTKRPLTGSQREKYKLPSFQIREGPTVNVDVTAPGSTLALGMLYMKSGNLEVAKWFEPPATHYLLNHVRPDLLLLRVIARGLILWEHIEPYEEWVEDYVPESIKPYCCVRPSDEHNDIDYEAMNQVYCNIVAGACFSIGLRFAGSANQDARDTILFYVKKMIMFGSKSIGELAGKATTETCLNLILISAAMVMAGTGDLDIMRLCRYQRSKAGPSASSLNYGSQVAVHSALGLLFLGGGCYTLCTSKEAIAALVCAFFPKFPLHSNDNRYHLQAFRHLYVLAAEPRLLIPRDISSGKMCYANVQVVTLDGSQLVNSRGPCLLPELSKLKEVRISDDRYWSIVFKRNRNWDQLLSLLEKSSCLDVKQKAGCLSYLEDPQGFKSLLAQMLTTEKSNVWSAKPNNILAFSTNQETVNFTKHYLFDALGNALFNNLTGNVKNTPGYKSDEMYSTNLCSACYFAGVTKVFKLNEKPEAAILRKRSSRINSAEYKTMFRIDSKCVCDKHVKEEREFIQILAVVTYECVIRDTMSILPVWITLIKILHNLPKQPNIHHIWQLKLLFAHIDNHNTRYNEAIEGDPENLYKITEPLISNEFAISLKQRVEFVFDSWEHALGKNLKSYIQNGQILPSSEHCDNNKLTSYVTYYDIPNRSFANNIGDMSEFNIFDLLADKEKHNLHASTMQKILTIINTHYPPE